MLYRPYWETGMPGEIRGPVAGFMFNETPTTEQPVKEINYRKDRIKLFLTAILILIGLVILIAVFRSSPNESRVNQTIETVPSINSSPEQTTAPISDVPRSWNVVVQFSGTSDKNTESFTIQETQWRIRWSATANYSYCLENGCLFAIQVCDMQKDYCENSLITDISGTESDTSNFYSAGTYYIKISAVSIDNWNVVVEDYSPTQQTTPSNTVSPKPKVEVKASNLNRFIHRVVHLRCPNMLNQDQTSAGSGIIINDKGYILTNFHVTSGVSGSIYIGLKCTVYLANDYNTFLIPTYTAFAVSVLSDYDAIILRIAEDENETIINPPFNLVPFKISGVVSNIGNDILILGFPGIDPKLTLTTGKITGFETINNRHMITVNAVAEKGESGGPLLNKDEDLIGVITATKENSTDNYAIDIRNITPWINAVIQDTYNLSSKDITTRPIDFNFGNSLGN